MTTRPITRVVRVLLNFCENCESHVVVNLRAEGRAPRTIPPTRPGVPEKVSEPLHRLRRLHLAQFAHPARHPARRMPPRASARRAAVGPFPVAQPANPVETPSSSCGREGPAPAPTFRAIPGDEDATPTSSPSSFPSSSSPPLARASFRSPSRAPSTSPARPQPREACNAANAENGSARSPGRRRAIEVVCAGEDLARRPPPVDAPPLRAFDLSVVRSGRARAAPFVLEIRRRRTRSFRVVPLGSGSRPTNAGSSASLVWSIPSTTGQSSRGRGFDSVDSGVGSPGEGVIRRASARWSHASRPRRTRWRRPRTEA